LTQEAHTAVLDASALLAMLHLDPGADIAERAVDRALRNERLCFGP